MQSFFLILIGLMWTGGICLRVYRQARFFQIEEYKANRYLRWWLSQRGRVLPRRPIMVAFVGAVLMIFLSEAPNSPVPGVIGGIASLIALWPPKQGEVKKAFRRTPRAIRILGTAFAIAVFDMAVISFLVSLIGIEASDFQLVALLAIGLVNFIAVPIKLVAANFLMYPVESFIRNGYIRMAKKTMSDIHPTVIGITGSYGKTTTKNYVTEILNGRYKAYATPKSYNTMMGVTLAINTDLANDYSIDYFVVEMGAYIRGEIQRIAGLTPPHISIVTEVGPQHLERFGSLENIAIAKYEIIKALPPDGVGVFNWDNPYVREMYERGYPNTRLAVSRTISPNDVLDGGPRFIATNVEETLDGLTFKVTDMETGACEPFTTRVIGEHNVTNILLATAVAIHEGMALRDVAFRVRMLQPAESRLVRQTTAQGITIINDAYSANPVGVVSALKVLGMHTTGRRLLITPGMIELADLHEPENKKLGEVAAQYATDVILVGAAQTRPIKAGLEAAHFPAERLQVVEELRQAVAWYQHNLKPGDTVLFLNDLPDTY